MIFCIWYQIVSTYRFSQELTPTLTLGLSLGLGLGLHFQDKKFFIYTTFKDFSLDVYDDIDVLHLVSDSQRFSFFQELTQTLTLGLSLGLGLAYLEIISNIKIFSS